MRTVSYTIVEKIKTHLIFIHFFLKSCRLWDNVEKYVRARKATNGNAIRNKKDAICFAGWLKQICRHILSIFNNYCSSTVKMVTRTAVVLRYTYIACLVLNIILQVYFFSAEIMYLLPSKPCLL